MKLIKAKKIIIGDGITVINNGYVAINTQGRIESIGEQSKIPYNSMDHETIDYGECTILPGLIDMHAHIGFWQKYSDKGIYDGHPSLISILAKNELEEALSMGVTTLRNPGDIKDHAYSIKMAYKKGFIKGPRYISCNIGITSTGGHGTQMKGMVIEADGEDEIRKAVRQQIKTGADWIKLLVSHRTHMCELTQQELNAAADESHRWLKKCCIHASTETAVQGAIDAGFDTIEHGTFMTVEQAQQMKERGIGWIPTIIPYWSEYQFMKSIIDTGNIPDKYKAKINSDYIYFKECTDRYKEYFAALIKTGITIAVGTDIITTRYPITPVADEMNLMVEHGMDILHVIQCATHNAAKLLGMDNEIGLLKENYIADIAVVSNDAQKDISALKDVVAVYQEGKITYKKK